MDASQTIAHDDIKPGIAPEDINTLQTKEKQWVIFGIKLGLTVGILAFLVWRAIAADAFTDLIHQQKNWSLLAAAAFLCLVGVMITIVRWYMLVRVIGIECKFSGAVRIGFLGYMFNLVPMGGIVAGDVVKAVMLGRESQKQYAKSFASVFIDRVIGLYALFLMALLFIYTTGFSQIDSAPIRVAVVTMIVCAAAGTFGFALVLLPDISNGWTTRMIGRTPVIGKKLEHLIESIQMYRSCPLTLLVTLIMSFGVHLSFALGLYLIASGLYGMQHPSLMYHLAISPISFATGAIPLAAGPFEYVLDTLYPLVPSVGASIKDGQGLVVAICYRVITIAIAMIGVGYYLTGREEVAEVIHTVQEEEVA